MQDPYHKTFDKQRNSVTPATFKKGIINQVYADSATADVQIVGNIQTILKNVPFAQNNNVEDIHPGDKCRIDMFDENNPNDSVVAYVYGRAASTPRLVSSGFATVNNVGFSGADVTIPHNLTGTPNLVVILEQDYTVTGGVVVTYVYHTADGTNIYLSPAGNALPGAKSFRWFAAII